MRTMSYTVYGSQCQNNTIVSKRFNFVAVTNSTNSHCEHISDYWIKIKGTKFQTRYFEFEGINSLAFCAI